MTAPPPLWKVQENETERHGMRRDETEATATAASTHSHPHSLEKQINTEGTKELFRLLAQVTLEGKYVHLYLYICGTKLEEHFDTDSDVY